MLDGLVGFSKLIRRRRGLEGVWRSAREGGISKDEVGEEDDEAIRSTFLVIEKRRMRWARGSEVGEGKGNEEEVWVGGGGSGR